MQFLFAWFPWADADLADHNLLEIAHRVPTGTLCLVTALARHNLTDIIPHQIDVAIPRGSRPPIFQSPVLVHFFAKDTFDIGREMFEVDDDKSVGLYSAERTIIDMIRLHHREGAEVAWEALRRWLRQRGSSPGKLLKMARNFHGAERALREALEIVL